MKQILRYIWDERSEDKRKGGLGKNIGEDQEASTGQQRRKGIENKEGRGGREWKIGKEESDNEERRDKEGD